jgi:hypothetical protein
VPKPLNGWADEASPRDSPRWREKKICPSVSMPFLRSSCPWKKKLGEGKSSIYIDERKILRLKWRHHRGERVIDFLMFYL